MMEKQSREELIQQIANWIDTAVITEIIVDHLEETEQQVNFDNAKDTWLSALEHLGGNVGKRL